MYKYKGLSTGSLLGDYAESGEERLRKVEFPVNWKSQVTLNGRFRSIKFESFGDPQTTFKPITDDERERYGIGTEENKTS
jgi:hypothetical protein